MSSVKYLWKSMEKLLKEKVYCYVRDTVLGCQSFRSTVVAFAASGIEAQQRFSAYGSSLPRLLRTKSLFRLIAYLG